MFTFGLRIRESVTSAIRDTLYPQISSYSSFKVEKKKRKKFICMEAFPLKKVTAKFKNISDKPDDIDPVALKPKYEEKEVWYLIETIHTIIWSPMTNKKEKSSLEMPPQIFINPTKREKELIMKKVRGKYV